MARRSASPLSSPRSSAASIRCAARSSAACCSASSTISRRPISRRNIAARSRCCCSSSSSCSGRTACSDGRKSAPYDGQAAQSALLRGGRERRPVPDFRAADLPPLRPLHIEPMGGDDDRRDRPQSHPRLCRPGVARSRRLCRDRRLFGGDPHHAWLAADRRDRASAGSLLRNRLAARLSRPARAASLSRLRHAGFLDPRLPGLSQRILADRRHGRDRQRAATVTVRLLAGAASALLLFLSLRPRLGHAGGARPGALALGTRLHRLARESDPGDVARRRYAALHPDGFCHRLGAGRPCRRALRAAGRPSRAAGFRADSLLRPPDDGDCRRRRLFHRSVCRRDDRGPAARLAALSRSLLSPPLCAAGHGAADLFADRACRHCRPLHRPPPDQGRLSGARGAQGFDGKRKRMSAVLQVANLKKRFGGIAAVDGVSFDVREGEILVIIGPNGCGKSTLFNCILGQLAPSEGEVRLDGRVTTGMRPCDLNRLGVSRTFQLLQIFPKLSVRDNLILAAQEHQGTMLGRLFGRRDAGLTEAAERMIAFFKLDHLADEAAGGLSYGQQKLLDAAMAFMSGPRLVLLDEPAGGVNLAMLANLNDRLRTFNKERGATFVVIEHNMDFVMSLCSRVLVLAEGRVLAEGLPAEVRANPAVIEAYLGH